MPSAPRLTIVAALLIFWAAAAAWPAAPCPPFFLKTDHGKIINPVTGENADQPYSPRQTCGTCHDYDRITRGYHFQTGWNRASDNRFPDTPWLVSDGFTGNFTPVGYYFLAKKVNTHPDEIDLTPFDFIARVPEPFKGYQKPGCAACHPGGGMLELDRSGQRYDRRMAADPGLAQSLDGDYAGSRWDRTGVIEADCLLCHSDRYDLQTRIRQMKAQNFKWAGTAAAGLGQVTGNVLDGQAPRVVYNLRLFNQDGTFVLPGMVFRPKAENCLLCHATIDMSKRGTSWDDPVNPDVHHLAGLTCVDCHFGDIDHNFAKGRSLDNRVRPDLNHTMRSCRDCHESGYRGATRMTHRGIRKNHLDKLSCEACHIPVLNRSAIGGMYLNTGRFAKHGQFDGKRFGRHQPWKPAYVIRKKDRDGIPRITPVNPMRVSLFTNRDKNGTYRPLYLSEIEKSYLSCKDGLTQRTVDYDFHDPKDITLMLGTLERDLAENHRFDHSDPHFHDGGRIYSLKSGWLAENPDTTWVSRLPFFSISHNVAPVEQALGAGGCTDCHAEGAHLFDGPVIIDYFADNGQPETVPMARFMGLSASLQAWNTFFCHYLKFANPAAAAGLIFLILVSGISAARNRLSAGLIKPVALVLCFFAGHILVFRDTGTFNAFAAYISGAFPFIGGMLILCAAALGMRWYARPVAARHLPILPAALFILILGSGVVLWIGPSSAADWSLLLTVFHSVVSITALFVAALFVLFRK